MNYQRGNGLISVMFFILGLALASYMFSDKQHAINVVNFVLDSMLGLVNFVGNLIGSNDHGIIQILRDGIIGAKTKFPDLVQQLLNHQQ